MKLLKRIVLSGLAVAFLTGMMVFTTPAQARVRMVSSTSQPVVVRRIFFYRPFYYDPFWDPYYYNSYYYDPYLAERRTRYYKEKAVRDARRRLARDREKYAYGYMTPKEREKLAKDQRKYNKAVASLSKYNSNY